MKLKMIVRVEGVAPPDWGHSLYSSLLTINFLQLIRTTYLLLYIAFLSTPANSSERNCSKTKDVT